MHVQINIQRGGDASLLIDGQDVTRHVLADGFGVAFDEETRGAVISMRLRPTSLTVEGDAESVPEPLQIVLGSPLTEGDV